MREVDDDRGTGLSLPQAPQGIEMRHLRAFVAVAEELNFGRAAERLYLSQPALSRQIRTLERFVGCELLRRSTHRVELTLAGDALLDRARDLIRGLDEAVSAVRSVGGELADRLARLWEPLFDMSADDATLQDLRTGFEALHAQLPMPPGIELRPANSQGVPCLILTPQPERPLTVLYLHGGGYVMGSAFGYRHLAGALAAAAKAGAVVPEYRLAPEHPFPAALDEALRAYRWMIERGPEPREITIMGDSSGGGLALSLLLKLKQEGLPLPGTAVLLCPAIDLSYERRREHTMHGSQKDAWLPIAVRCVAWYLAGHPVDDPIVNPLVADLSGLPPMLVQAATGDPQLEDANQLVAHARSQGVDAQLELYPVATHAFQLFWSFLPEAADALRQAGSFVHARTASGAGPLPGGVDASGGRFL
jgi:monoterpene epsilon-lactone hydrolase